MQKRTDEQRLILAREVLEIEADALHSMAGRLSGDFCRAMDAILGTSGRLIVTGMGKSGHIARKIAATLASTGTPAYFVHPAEAAHGDLGMITNADILLALSNSGESAEVLALLPALKRKGVTLIAMTGRAESTLAREANIHLDTWVEREACPLGLAPTASTTAALAMGDALAVALLEEREFQEEDFALSHPGGSLGRRLLVRVADLMHQNDELPVVKSHASLKEALLVMTEKGLGMTAVVDDQNHLLGIYTDGDLRRTLDKTLDLSTLQVDDVMTVNPHTIAAGRLATEAVRLMELKKITGLMIVDEEQHLLGALHMHDLLKAGVV